jgi:hypothetical protein
MLRRRRKLMISSFGGTGMGYFLAMDYPLIFLISSHIFPSYSSAQRALTKNSALAKIKEKRARIKEGIAASRAARREVGVVQRM